MGMQTETRSAPDHQRFTVHWAQVPSSYAQRIATEGFALFALWPSPVIDDTCFRAAGFTKFGDGDESWDVHADALLVRLLTELTYYGQPHLVSKPAEKHQPWYRRLFSKPEPLGLQQQIELPIQWDELPDCLVAFGESGASLRTGKGHHIFWVVVPQPKASAFVSLISRVALPNPLIETELRWEYLL